MSRNLYVRYDASEGLTVLDLDEAVAERRVAFEAGDTAAYTRALARERAIRRLRLVEDDAPAPESPGEEAGETPVEEAAEHAPPPGMLSGPVLSPMHAYALAEVRRSHKTLQHAGRAHRVAKRRALEEAARAGVS